MKSVFQKLLTKMGSRSKMMELGNPCSLTTMSANNFAVVATVNWVGKALKWADLVRQSTTVSMTVKLRENGRHVIKSMVISSHTKEGIGSG